jgi:fermentation-respiration switch protein FrsA (DUF1100 family)
VEEEKSKQRTAGRSIFKRLVRVVLCILVGNYLALFCYAFFFTEKTIFQPPVTSYKDTEQILKIPSPDGTQIAAIYLRNPHARYTLLYSHGNAEDLGQLRPMLLKLQEMGYSVLAYDYHGYGTTPGTPTEANAYRDEEAAYDYLIKQRGVVANRIVAMGHSLGCAMAIDLASRRPLGGIIVESAFVSADRIVTGIPLLPFDKFQNLAKISHVRCPVLVMHGKQDRVVPFWHGERLFAAANEPKRSVWIEGAGHNDLFEVAGPRYAQALQEFVAQLETGRPR